MTINLVEINNTTIAEINSESIVLKCVQDAVDIIGNCGYQGASKVIIEEKNIVPEFFDLKTKVAGDVLQKFSTYNSQLAIVGDFSKFSSKSLKDFIYESNKTGRIFFVSSLEEAREKLAKQ